MIRSMSDAAAQPDSVAKSCRQSFQFSLRTLLGAVTICAILFAAVRAWGPESLTVLPFLGGILGAAVAAMPGRPSLFREAFGGGFGAAGGLILANLLLHLGWRF